MKSYVIFVKGFNEQYVSEETPGKAKYKLWLKSACDTGYWENFFDFCKSCRVLSVYRAMKNIEKSEVSE